MALASNVLRTCGILFYIVNSVCGLDNISKQPWILSFKVSEKSCVDFKCKYLLKVHGGEYLGHSSWRLTPNAGARGVDCENIYASYELREIKTEQSQSEIEVFLPQSNDKIYFCLMHTDGTQGPFSGKWVHQGSELFLQPSKDEVQSKTGHFKELPETNNELQAPKDTNELQETNKEWADLSHDTDVNYISNVAKPSRAERNAIEVLIDNKYVPLNDTGYENLIEKNYINNNDIYNGNDYIDRRKRETNKTVLKEESTNGLDKAVIHKSNDSDAKIDIAVNNSDIYTEKDDNSDNLDSLSFNKEDFNVDGAKMKRQLMFQVTDFTGVKSSAAIFLDGLRVEEAEKDPKILEDGIPSVLADTKVTLRLFGQGLSQRTVIAFTHDALEYGQPCKFLLKGEHMAVHESVTATSALFQFRAPSPIIGSKMYICAKNLKEGVTDPSEDEEKYIHQGVENWKIFATHNKLMPLWVAMILILVCLTFSALFSGLNLGLMSLDRTELKIISNTGTEQERKYARAIMPVRDHGNYLLCSILLGNVAVNSTFTILLDELTSGLFAVIFSTLSIVLLGEITPQAICSRHGLMIGARSIMITKAVMALTAPLAYPVSKLLDYFLGEEIGSVYNRERLKELVKLTTDVNDLDKDEVNIISGALELRKKTVSSVMTKLEDVFMLPITSILDFETMSEIIKSGYSRIPVYEGHRGNIVTVLFIKDLAFVDPDDNTPLRTLCQYYQNPCNFVFEDVTLDVMFKQFKDGHKGHMAFVHRINSEGEGDPFYETVGLVTLEDVIEEMIQAEIVDETDVFLDNRTKRRRNRPQHKLQDFAAFAERHEHRRIHISPQLTLATFQFLSTSVDAFKPDVVSETVLRRLLKQDVIHHIKVKGKTKKDVNTYVFQQGKPVDYFVLILEGRVEVTVGRENLVFEAGPFTYFGVQALTQNVGLAESPTPSAMGSLQNINMDSMLRHTFVPDYSVRAVTEMFYLTVKRSLYLAAKRASLMEKGALSKGATNEQFDTEVDKLLESVDEDISISGEHKTPSRQVSPNPCPTARSSLPRSSPERNGDVFARADEQEKLLKH
ncbi:unextended protein-like isoform X1 [Colias croceus]|uniref:unextended protein-like isoform X1 n=1 Tax=Colias crocea TaxID=72248 RepID=UPI001E27A590|nr:unextended protein-like isoform X1 [Colias croceus]